MTHLLFKVRRNKFHVEILNTQSSDEYHVAIYIYDYLLRLTAAPNKLNYLTEIVFLSN